jgi:hypothetical protein
VPFMTTSRTISALAVMAAAIALCSIALQSSPTSAASTPLVRHGQKTALHRPATAQRAATDTPSPRKLTGVENYTYAWPVKPFRAQHPVRGFFGDPRIANDGESRQFHFGIDISARNGTPVYATLSGRVWIHPLHETTVEVTGTDGVEFSYWHVVPSVRTGDHAVAYRTVIGHVEAPYGHVHFSEARDGRYLNPLRPGGLGPYSDTTRPEVFRFTTELDGHPADPVSGQQFELVAETRDQTPLAVPRPWLDLPVMPAVVRWRLLDAREGSVIGWRTVVDFRETIPPASEFDRIWAPGTTQNHVRQPGRYRLCLTHPGELSWLQRGSYTIEIALSDTRGNASLTRIPLVVAGRLSGS